MQWIRLEDALNRKRKPFPRPFHIINQCQVQEFAAGNIGAELDFGKVKITWGDGEKEVPARIILFHLHKDVTGPVMSYWYALWHKNLGYREFDIRWIWKFLGEQAPLNWMDHKRCLLEILGCVRDTLKRVPEDRRNELIEAIGSGQFLAEEKGA